MREILVFVAVCCAVGCGSVAGNPSDTSSPSSPDSDTSDSRNHHSDGDSDTPPPSGCTTVTNVWANSTTAAEQGSFSATFDVTPTSAAADAVLGFSGSGAADYTDVAAVVRFNDSGAIDARNSGAYAASAALTYSATQTYHLRFAVDVGAHTYDVYVTPPGASEQQIATQFAFRSEQASAPQLANFAANATTGSVSVCNLTVTTSNNPPPTTPFPPSPSPSNPPPSSGTPPTGSCQTDVWNDLEACGWPGPANTGPDMSQCPNGLAEMGSTSMPMPTFDITTDGTVIACQRIHGQLHITARNVTVRNSYIEYDTGKRGTDANGTAPISIDDGASATVDHVEINGLIGTHACIWNQGTPDGDEQSLIAEYVNCYNVDDGIFSWADTGYSQTTGDGFTIKESYFHDLTPLTSNGHMDGYQTEGAKNGQITHNTYALSTETDSCVAIWDSLKSSDSIVVANNLMEGGGASIYAEDYDPSESSPQGGNSTTNIQFNDNVFSTHESACVGAFFVWYSRPAQPYGGGPTDGWHRSGNYVLETGESVDAGNPHIGGQLCN